MLKWNRASTIRTCGKNPFFYNLWISKGSIHASNPDVIKENIDKFDNIHIYVFCIFTCVNIVHNYIKQ